MATLYLKTAGGNWSDAATWSSTGAGGVDSAGPPTAADDVILELLSGNLTINAAAACRSISLTSGTGSYGGVITHNAAIILSIGDGTAGAGNVALDFGSTFTYTLGNSVTSEIDFVSTSATQQTVNFNGKTTGVIHYQGVGSSYLLTGSHTCGVTSTMELRNGTLNTNGQSVTWGIFNSNNSNARVLTLGASAITITGTGTTAWNVQTSTNYTLSASSSTITLTGTDSNFIGGTGKVYGTVNLNGAGVSILDSSSTFTNLSRTGSASKTDRLNLTAATTTVTGTLTLAGNSATNRLLVQSTTVGTTKTIDNTGATETWSNVDFQDIALSEAFDASGITGNSGDCGGNSGITFTTAATQTYTGGTDSWSTAAKWTSRVPLPQDDVLMSGVTGGTITADMPRLGKSIDWTGAAGTPTWTNSVAQSLYGSLDISGIGVTSGINALTLSGRGAYTLTSNSVQFTQGITISCPSGSYTLQDNFSSARNFTLTIGGFDANNKDVTFTSFLSSNTNVRSLTMGTGTWTLNSTSGGTIWDMGTTTNLTFSGSSSIVTIGAVSASTRTFVGGSKTYGTLVYTVAGSTGALTITGTNSFSGISFSDITNARTLQFTAATTTTITSASGWSVNGTSEKLMTVQSATAATHTISCTTGTISSDYLNLVNSIASGGASFYAGANSTDGTGNTGWIFTGVPASTQPGLGSNEQEYSFLAGQNSVYQGSLNEQRLRFYNTESGSNYNSVDEAEMAFLKNKTGSTLNSRADLWRVYLGGLGIAQSFSINEMKQIWWAGSSV